MRHGRAIQQNAHVHACRLPGARCQAHLVRDEQGSRHTSTCGVESRHARLRGARAQRLEEHRTRTPKVAGSRRPARRTSSTNQRRGGGSSQMGSPSSAGPRRPNPSAPTAPVVSGRAQIGGPSAAGLRGSTLGGQLRGLFEDASMTHSPFFARARTGKSVTVFLRRFPL